VTLSRHRKRSRRAAMPPRRRASATLLRHFFVDIWFVFLSPLVRERTHFGVKKKEEKKVPSVANFLLRGEKGGTFFYRGPFSVFCPSPAGKNNKKYTPIVF